MRSHSHGGGGTQNQNNTLGDRSCVRQSKLFRQYESGNNVKNILGSSHLAWKTDQKEGAYEGHEVYDHKTSGHVHGKSTSYQPAPTSPSKRVHNAEAAAVLKAQILHDEVSRADRHGGYKEENIMSLVRRIQDSPSKQLSSQQQRSPIKSALKKAVRMSEPEEYTGRHRRIPDYDEDDDVELAYLRERLRRLDSPDLPAANDYLKHVSKADLNYLTSGRYIGRSYEDEGGNHSRRAERRAEEEDHRSGSPNPNPYSINRRDVDEEDLYNGIEIERLLDAKMDPNMPHTSRVREEIELLERQLLLNAQIKSLQRISNARLIAPAPYAVSASDMAVPVGRAEELRRQKTDRLAAMMLDQGMMIMSTQSAKEKKMIEASKITRPW